MLLEALYKALDQLSESDCDLIRALYFEGKTLSEYGEEKGCAISTLSERRKRILRDLKKVLKIISHIFPYTSEKEFTFFLVNIENCISGD